MRDYDEEDPKKPHPVFLQRKGDNESERQEHEPHEVRPRGKRRHDPDDHRHVSY